jgi:hypothetical protein
MAPCFDIYVRLPGNERSAVERFLDRHLSRWRVADTWSHSDDADRIIEAGLSGSASGEVLYAGVRDSELEFVMLAFPVDGGVVLGVSIDLTANEAAVGAWLDRMLAETGAREGFAQAEEPPPLSDDGWRESMGRAMISTARG